MEWIVQIYDFLSSGQGLDILTAILAVLGGLKVLARYTPFEWDNHVLEMIERPFKWIAEKVRK